MANRESKYRFQSETLLQSVGIAVVLTIGARILGFGRGVIFSRVMSPEDLGTWALLNNAMQLLGVVIVIGLPGGIARYVERYRQNGSPLKFLATSVGRTAMVACCVAVVGILLREPFAKLVFGTSQLSNLGLFVWIATLSLVGFNVLQSIMQGLRSFRLNAALQFAQGCMFTLVASGLLIGWRRDVWANAWAHLSATLVSTVVLGWWLWRSKIRHLSDDKPMAKTAWKHLVFFSLGTWGGNALMEIWRSMDRYMLLHFNNTGREASLGAIGNYYIAERIIEPIGAFAYLLSLILLPHAVHLWEAAKEKDAVKMVQFVTKVTVLLLSFFGMITVVLRPWILHLVCGRVPAEASAVIAPVVVTTVTLSIHYMIRSYLWCRERPWSAAAVWPVCIAINFGLNCLLISRYQLLGAVVATMVSAAVGTLTILLIACYRGLRLDRGTIAVCLVPALILLPEPIMLAGFTVLVLLILGSSWILSTDEKRQLNQWLAARFARWSDSPGGVAAT